MQHEASALGSRPSPAAQSLPLAGDGIRGALTRRRGALQSCAHEPLSCYRAFATGTRSPARRRAPRPPRPAAPADARIAAAVRPVARAPVRARRRPVALAQGDAAGGPRDRAAARLAQPPAGPHAAAGVRDHRAQLLPRLAAGVRRDLAAASAGGRDGRAVRAAEGRAARGRVRQPGGVWVRACAAPRGRGGAFTRTRALVRQACCVRRGCRSEAAVRAGSAQPCRPWRGGDAVRSARLQSLAARHHAAAPPSPPARAPMLSALGAPGSAGPACRERCMCLLQVLGLAIHSTIAVAVPSIISYRWARLVALSSASLAWFGLGAVRSAAALGRWVFASPPAEAENLPGPPSPRQAGAQLQAALHAGARPADVRALAGGGGAGGALAGGARPAAALRGAGARRGGRAAACDLAAQRFCGTAYYPWVPGICPLVGPIHKPQEGARIRRDAKQRSHKHPADKTAASQACNPAQARASLLRPFSHPWHQVAAPKMRS